MCMKYIVELTFILELDFSTMSEFQDLVHIYFPLVFSFHFTSAHKYVLLFFSFHLTSTLE